MFKSLWTQGWGGRSRLGPSCVRWFSQGEDVRLPPMPAFDVKRAVDEHAAAAAAIDDLAAGRKPRTALMKQYKVIQRDDSQNFVLLFPGQGSQFVGMGEATLHVPKVREMFDRASQILEFDLLKMCLAGPQNVLDQTRYCQAAVVVCSLAAVEKLYADCPESVERCVATAGFSVGEITALIFSGAISFDEGLRLVKVRSEAMQYCSELAPSGMMTVFFGAKNNLKLGLSSAKKWVGEKHGIENPVCQVANYLYAGAKVIGGHQEALKFIEDNQMDFGIRRTKRLNVSGAFHTSLMDPAVSIFKTALDSCNVQDARIPVHSNLKGLVYTKRNYVLRNLHKQIVRPVAWEQTMCNMFRYEKDENMPNIVECGPGRGLSGILYKINGKAGKRAKYIQV